MKTRAALLLLVLVPALVAGQGAGGGGGGGGGVVYGGDSGGGCDRKCGIAVGCILGGIAAIGIGLGIFFAWRKAGRVLKERNAMLDYIRAAPAAPPAGPVPSPQGPQGQSSKSTPTGTTDGGPDPEAPPAAAPALRAGRWRVAGTYTGAQDSRVNRGTHDTSCDATLSAGREFWLLLKGSGKDKWGKFSIDGAMGLAGQQAPGPIRAAFMKQYSSGTYVKYTGLLSGAVLRGEWRVLNDKEHGTFELRFTQQRQAAAPVPAAAPAPAPAPAARPEGARAVPAARAGNAGAAPAVAPVAAAAPMFELAEPLLLPAASAPPMNSEWHEDAVASPSGSVARGVPGGPSSDNRV